jgi:fructose-1-phosphate kinase PfkB-like protein
MFYRVFREYNDGDEIHVGVFANESDALTAAEDEVADTAADVIVSEEGYGAYVKGRELHRFHGSV